MERRQSVCALTTKRSSLTVAVMLCVLVLGCAGIAMAQANTADLSGTVTDPSGGVIKGAKVTVTFLATGVVRTTTTDESGHYSFVQLTPGHYKMSVDAGGDFALEIPDLVLTVGAAAVYDAHLRLRSQSQTIEVTGTTALVETQRTEVSQTVDQRRIENLPINGRNYINFTLTDSQANRDSSPSIGAAPTSGLNFGGQRARSNEVSVDGADAVDKSVGGVRATVSQEAVQEFQVITSNYMPEYGRATGGVVNIVTKSGSNEVHGNVFGFLRATGIQARDPFSVQGTFNPATDSVTLTPRKQSYTRAQAGATLGGPLQKDKTFYFFSYETIRAQTNGFTSIGQNNFGLVPESYPAGAAACGVTTGLVTPAQKGFLSVAPVAAGAPYFCLAAASSAVALFGNTGALPGPLNSFPENGTACGGAPCLL